MKNLFLLACLLLPLSLVHCLPQKHVCDSEPGQCEDLKILTYALNKDTGGDILIEFPKALLASEAALQIRQGGVVSKQFSLGMPQEPAPLSHDTRNYTIHVTTEDLKSFTKGATIQLEIVNLENQMVYYKTQISLL